MKVFLMFEKDDFETRKKLLPNSAALVQDLELGALFASMASGDEFIHKIAKEALLSGTFNDIETILYRQEILKDSIENQLVVREIYRLSTEALLSRNEHWWFLSSSPSSVLYSSIASLKDLLDYLKQLKALADEHAAHFQSKGFSRFFAMLQKELDEDFMAEAWKHIKELEFHDGALFNTQLGKGNKGYPYQLCKLPQQKQGWVQMLFPRKKPGYTFNVHPRDESGARALREIKDEGVNVVANALAQSMEHIFSFFSMLKTEIAFYTGCLNLHGQLASLGAGCSFPQPLPGHLRTHVFRGLYDVSLALAMKQKVVANDAVAENKNLVIITGANQGGKSTFLRSIGLAQLMMQCGMFVPAASFSANTCSQLFSHFKREEDSAMNSGKLDEELSRMSSIADNLSSHSMILFNESFAATNEREGSEIGRQIVNALIEKGVKVFFVTHLYDFAQSFYVRKLENALFLRAERQADGARTFKLVEGEPLQTSFGKDLYNKIFDNPDAGI
ncbi:MAG TPA: hypothetical protein VIO15_13990 [Bacteroidales bacterium]